MQKFAPKNAVFPRGNCPSAEDLAAYVDGVLDKAESRRIEEHLASCESCYATYEMTLRFELDSSPANPESAVDGDLLPFRPPGAAGRGRAAAARWLPLAALLLAGAGTGTYFQLLAPPPTLVTTDLAPSKPPSGQSLWLGPTFRGEGGGEEVKLNEAAFRMGVQLVNLQAMLQAGNVRESQDVIARILNILKGQPFTDDFYKRYAAIPGALEQRPPNQFLPEASQLSREVREVFEPTDLDFGQWVEGARLAALARDPSFFQQSAARDFLRRLLWRTRLKMGNTRLDPAGHASLQKIADVVSRGDLQTADYDEIQRQLDKILGIYYPET